MSSFTETWLPGPKSSSFYTRTYHPPSGSPSAVVVFVHGFAEHVARYEYVHKRWADRGFVVFTFDQRGWGRTALDPKKTPGSVYGRTGDVDQIADIAWALSVAQEANPTVPLFLMGHSMVCDHSFAPHPLSGLCCDSWLTQSRAVGWSCRSRRVPIPRIAYRSYRASLQPAPVFTSPSRHWASYAGSAPAPAPFFLTRTFRRPLIPKCVASLTFSSIMPYPRKIPPCTV